MTIFYTIPDTLRLLSLRTALKRWKSIFPLVIFCLMLIVPLISNAEDDWNGWRGGVKQGRSQQHSAPTDWALDQNIEWRTSIPGEGYSSPIKIGNSVYVTTAYLTDKTRLIKEISLGVKFFLAVSFLLLLINYIYLTLLKDFTNTTDYAGVSAVSLFSAVILLFTIFGTNALDLPRCSIRGWLLSSLLMSFALLISEVGNAPGSKRRFVKGLLGLFFALLIFTGMPLREHVFRGTLFNGRVFLFALALTPSLIIGLLFILDNRLASLHQRSVGNPSANRGEGNFRSPLIDKTLLSSLFVAVVVGGSIYLIWPRKSSAWLPPVADIGSPYLGILTWTLLNSIIFALIYFLRCAGRKDDRVSENDQRKMVDKTGKILSSGLGVVSLMSMVPILIILSVKCSQKLSYYINAIVIQPDVGWGMLIAGLFISIAAFLLSRYIPVVRQAISIALVLPVFRNVVLILMIATFIEVNYISGISNATYSYSVISLDANTGEHQWSRECFESDKSVFHRANSPASSTPVVREQRVFAYFGDAGVVCLSAEGEILWKNEDITYGGIYGLGVSPVFSNHRLIIMNGFPSGGYLCALDSHTGELLWKQDIHGKEISGIGGT